MGGRIEEVAPESLDPASLWAQVQELLARVSEQDREIQTLQHRIEQLVRYRYGRRREADHPGQLTLSFAEAPEEPTEPVPEHVHEAPDDEETVARYQRQKARKGRAPIPPELPRERVEVHPPEAERTCRTCAGALRPFSEEVSEALEYRPAAFFVRQTARIKYACPACETGVTIAPARPRPIERGLPGPGLLAQVLVAKYADHLPLHRQEEIFRRHGVELRRSTMCDWVRAAAVLLEPIVKELRRLVLASHVIQSDDTPITVQDRNAPGGSRRAYLWVWRGDQRDVVFRFTRSRSRDGPLRFLGDYAGRVQADAYQGYDEVFQSGAVVEVGCWAHARRYFYFARTTAPAEATRALAFLRQLYEVERQARDQGLEPEARRALREERARPVLTQFQRWMDELEPRVLPKSPLGEALGYARRQRTALSRYLSDGALAIDNNAAERALRQVAVGRKNWLFAGSDAGGERAAILYSVIGTCKENGVDSYAYLTDVLDRVSTHPARLVNELTPRGWQAARRG